MSETLDVQERTEAEPDARTCPECDGEVRQSEDERRCTDCGLVVATDELDRGPEWRNFDDGPSLTVRCNGRPTSPAQHDGGLGTEISYTDEPDRLDRQRQYHTRFQSKRERGQAYANGQIHRLTAALELPTAVRDRACTLFEEAQEAEITLGRSLDAGAAAAVLAAAREMDFATEFGEIVELAREDRSLVLRSWKAMCREIDCYQLPPQPSELIAKLASATDAPPAVEQRARELTTALEATGRHSGKCPSGVAAGAIYVAMREHDDDRLTQEEIAEAADVSAITLRKGMQLLEEVGEIGGAN